MFLVYRSYPVTTPCRWTETLAELSDYLQSEEGQAAIKEVKVQQVSPVTAAGIQKPVVGIAAFTFILLVSDAPIFDGGSALMQWLSYGDNIKYIIIAVAFGILSPMFIPNRD